MTFARAVDMRLLLRLGASLPSRPSQRVYGPLASRPADVVMVQHSAIVVKDGAQMLSFTPWAAASCFARSGFWLISSICLVKLNDFGSHGLPPPLRDPFPGLAPPPFDVPQK